MEKLVLGLIDRYERPIRFSVPSLFSLSRLPFIPFIIWSISNGYNVLALFLFLVAAFTDFLDGFFARLLKSSTEIGAFLDPLCDKILILSTLWILKDCGQLPLAAATLFWFLFVAEVALVMIRCFFLVIKINPAANWTGKTKMGLEITLVAAALIGMGNIFLVWLMVLVAIAASLSLVGQLDKTFDKS